MSSPIANKDRTGIHNPILTFIGRILFKCPSHDFHCGVQALRKEASERLDLRTDGMEFASEIDKAGGGPAK